LGSPCEFTISWETPDLEYQVFLKHERIFYLKPLSEWKTTKTVQLFPEAPGKYVLVLKWRHLENNGFVEFPFEVLAQAPMAYSPQFVRVDENTSFWTPNQWEAQQISNYEKKAVKWTLKQAKKGWTIFDIGANLGYYSIFLAKAVGNEGRVYSFEANPLCVYYLQTNLAQNQIENCEIFPAAIMDKNESIPFTINYATSAVGVIEKSIFYVSKAGHEIVVQSCQIDWLIETRELKPPDLIKIDIEGAEQYALQGMEKTLAKYHPVILLEVHGKDAATHCIPMLEQLGYRFQNMDGKQFHSADKFLASFPDIVAQVLCTSKEFGLFSQIKELRKWFPKTK
jgi:FkbM family methyltransferase